MLPPKAFVFMPPKDRIAIGEVTHPDFVAELEWTDWPLDAQARIAMRRSYDAELDIEVVEQGTGLPVPRFAVSVRAQWGRSSSPDAKVAIVPDPQLRSLLSVRDDDLAEHGIDGRLRRKIRIVDGADNRLMVHVRRAEAIVETLPVALQHGEVIRRRYEVTFDRSASVAGNTVVRGVVVDAVTEQPIVGAYVDLEVLDADGQRDFERSPSTTTRPEAPDSLESMGCRGSEVQILSLRPFTNLAVRPSWRTCPDGSAARENGLRGCDYPPTSEFSVNTPRGAA